MENNDHHHHPYLHHHHNHPLHQWPAQQHQQHFQLYGSYFPLHLYHYQQQFQQGLIYYEQQQLQQQHQPYLHHQLQPSDQLFQQQHAQQQQHEQQQQQQQPVQGVIHYEGGQGLLDCIPCGYRFAPTDEELIMHYLRKKMDNLPLPENRIHEVDVYGYSPQELTSIYPWDTVHKENEWFFFTTLKSKYPNGSRPSRTCANDVGFWKPTGSDKIIRYQGSIIGHKKTLDFLQGKKSDWKMHEYRIEEKCAKLVLCRIYLKKRR